MLHIRYYYYYYYYYVLHITITTIMTLIIIIVVLLLLSVQQSIILPLDNKLLWYGNIHYYGMGKSISAIHITLHYDICLFICLSIRLLVVSYYQYPFHSPLNTIDSRYYTFQLVHEFMSSLIAIVAQSINIYWTCTRQNILVLN